MTERSRNLAINLARVGAVVIALAVLTHLVIGAQRRHNPDAVHPATNSSGAEEQTGVPTSESTPELVVTPGPDAFLSSSKSLVIETDPSKAPVFLPSSKFARYPTEK